MRGREGASLNGLNECSGNVEWTDTQFKFRPNLHAHRVVSLLRFYIEVLRAVDFPSTGGRTTSGYFLGGRHVTNYNWQGGFSIGSRFPARDLPGVWQGPRLFDQVVNAGFSLTVCRVTPFYITSILGGGSQGCAIGGASPGGGLTCCWIRVVPRGSDHLRRSRLSSASVASCRGASFRTGSALGPPRAWSCVPCISVYSVQSRDALWPAMVERALSPDSTASVNASSFKRDLYSRCHYVRYLQKVTEFFDKVNYPPLRHLRQ